MATLPDPATGAELADYRRRLGLTQDDVARGLHVHRVTLSKWERAERVSAITAEKYRRAAEQAAREALVGDWTEAEKREAWGR